MQHSQTLSGGAFASSVNRRVCMMYTYICMYVSCILHVCTYCMSWLSSKLSYCMQGLLCISLRLVRTPPSSSLYLHGHHASKEPHHFLEFTPP